MSAFQRAAVIAAMVVSVGVAIYEAHRASRLESELHVLQARDASLALHTEQQTSNRQDREARAERTETHGNAPTGVSSELLRLRGEVGLLRRDLATAEAKAQASTNQISFSYPVLPRGEWSDQGTAKPQNTILTMFWALRQGDQNKLEQLVLPLRDSQTLDDFSFPRDEWDKFSAIQVAKVVVARQLTAGKVTAETATVQVIAEKALGADGADKDADIYRWVLTKENGQWLIRSRL
jgi:hypothetical protein